MSKFRILIQEEALLELQEAYFWYDSQKPGLGEAFIREFENCLELLSAHPQHYSQISERYRKIRLRRFPFRVFYEVNEDSVVIIRVRHDAQRPIA